MKNQTSTNPNIPPASHQDQDTNFGETGYFVAQPLSTKDIAAIEQSQETQKSKPTDATESIVSFVATIIPIILWIYCSIASKGSLNEGDTGAVWWLLMIYYWTFGLPLILISIVFGVKGLNTSWHRLAAISLCLKILTIVAIGIFLFIGILTT